MTEEKVQERISVCEKCPKFNGKSGEIYVETLERLLQEKDNNIDECTEILKNSKEYKIAEVMGLNSNQSVLAKLLEKLQHAKGNCDDE